MTLWRVLPWDPTAPAGQRGHALWVPRVLQGAGRHDAPDRYGCLYLSEAPTSAVAEMLAPFRGTGRLGPELLIRSGLRLGLAELTLDSVTLIDLDNPRVLTSEALTPSVVATGHRETTQAYAVQEFERHPEAAGLRWWSTLEASWLQVTLFDRAVAALSVQRVYELAVGDEAVVRAAAHLGLA